MLHLSREVCCQSTFGRFGGVISFSIRVKVVPVKRKGEQIQNKAKIMLQEMAKHQCCWRKCMRERTCVYKTKIGRVRQPHASVCFYEPDVFIQIGIYFTKKKPDKNTLNTETASTTTKKSYQVHVFNWLRNINAHTCKPITAHEFRVEEKKKNLSNGKKPDESETSGRAHETHHLSTV